MSEDRPVRCPACRQPALRVGGTHGMPERYMCQTAGCSVLVVDDEAPERPRDDRGQTDAG